MLTKYRMTSYLNYIFEGPEDWPYCSGGCIDHHDELAAGLIKELPDNVLEADMNIISNLSLSSSTSSPMLSKLAVTDAAIDKALRAMGLLAEGYQEALKEGRYVNHTAATKGKTASASSKSSSSSSSSSAAETVRRRASDDSPIHFVFR